MILSMSVRVCYRAVSVIMSQWQSITVADAAAAVVTERAAIAAAAKRAVCGTTGCVRLA